MRLGDSAQVEEVANGNVGEGIESRGGGAMELRGIAKLCHGEAGGGMAEVVRHESCPVIGHELLGEEIRVSAGGIVWSPLGIECFGDIEGRKLKGNLSGC
ncbi:hypothetical protein JHK82_035868 [Glycine max]|nr:hypothetical protein JHK86_036004 [Glycine max]KAG5112599.1 hypothetical protein JHK82_035868 [Glycine max]